MKTHKVGLVGLGWAAGAHLRTFVALLVAVVVLIYMGFFYVQATR